MVDFMGLPVPPVECCRVTRKRVNDISVDLKALYLVVYIVVDETVCHCPVETDRTVELEQCRETFISALDASSCTQRMIRKGSLLPSTYAKSTSRSGQSF